MPAAPERLAPSNAGLLSLIDVGAYVDDLVSVISLDLFLDICAVGACGHSIDFDHLLAVLNSMYKVSISAGRLTIFA